MNPQRLESAVGGELGLPLFALRKGSKPSVSGGNGPTLNKCGGAKLIVVTIIAIGFCWEPVLMSAR